MDLNFGGCDRILKERIFSNTILDVVPGRKGSKQAPHIALVIFARGINLGLHTRVYFDDEAEANANDPLLNGIEWAPRREILIAKCEERDGQVVYRFDIRVQGENETVFLDI